MEMRSRWAQLTITRVTRAAVEWTRGPSPKWTQWVWQASKTWETRAISMPPCKLCLHVYPSQIIFSQHSHTLEMKSLPFQCSITRCSLIFGARKGESMLKSLLGSFETICYVKYVFNVFFRRSSQTVSFFYVSSELLWSSVSENFDQPQKFDFQIEKQTSTLTEILKRNFWEFAILSLVLQWDFFTCYNM